MDEEEKRVRRCNTTNSFLHPDMPPQNLISPARFTNPCCRKPQGSCSIENTTMLMLAASLASQRKRVRVKLPPLGLGFVPWVTKAVLSSDPSRNKKFYVVVKYVNKRCSRLAFHKHGDGGDNTLADFDCESKRYYDEIIFHKNLLYVLCLGDSKSIEVWDFGGTYPIRTMEFQPPERGIQQSSYHCYLVEYITG
ncbi:hypothetical protein M0R45_017627 [Rubus argutus]|uniref:KIB1-4 beta-propeller domain-containing protein n=1 Tax=Rubus argutus TaxID=59490 RepID=A0AAW1XVI7_RUBAR